MFPENKTRKGFFHIPPSRNSTQKQQRDCVTSLEKYKKLFTFLFQGNTFRKFLNLLLFYLPVFFNCQQHLHLLLFSLNFIAFSACTCESGVTQRFFRVWMHGAWCVGLDVQVQRKRFLHAAKGQATQVPMFSPFPLSVF